MKLLTALWHVIRGHRLIAITSDSRRGVFVFCYECFNARKTRQHLGYFQFAAFDSEIYNRTRDYPWSVGD